MLNPPKKSHKKVSATTWCWCYSLQASFSLTLTPSIHPSMLIKKISTIIKIKILRLMLYGALLTIYLSLDFKIYSWWSGLWIDAFNQIFYLIEGLFYVNIKTWTETDGGFVIIFSRSLASPSTLPLTAIIFCFSKFLSFLKPNLSICLICLLL